MKQRTDNKEIAEVQLQELTTVALIIVVSGLVIAFGTQILGDTRDDDADLGVTASCGLNSTGGTGGTILYTNCGADYNATQNAIVGTVKLSSKYSTIASVVVGVIIIGLLFKFFAFSKA